MKLITTLLMVFLALFSYGQENEIKYYNNTIIPHCEEGKTVTLELDNTSQIANFYKLLKEQLFIHVERNNITEFHRNDETGKIQVTYNYNMSLEDLRTALEKLNYKHINHE